MLPPDVTVLLQTVLLLDLFDLQHFVLPLHMSVLQQPVLSLDPDVSVLELSVSDAPGRVGSTAACVALGHVGSTEIYSAPAHVCSTAACAVPRSGRVCTVLELSVTSLDV